MSKHSSDEVLAFGWQLQHLTKLQQAEVGFDLPVTGKFYVSGGAR